MTWATSNFSGNGVSALFGGSFYGTSQTFAGDTIKVALYGTTPTPNKDDTLAHNSYNGAGGQWVTANESTGTGYTAGGGTLASKSNTEATGVVTITGANQAFTITGTLSATFGDLVYDSTVTGTPAYCWNYFGGTQTVTAGTFTVVWNGSGIATITIT